MKLYIESSSNLDELTFDESYTGDQIEPLFLEACDRLNVLSDPAVQGGNGIDFIRDKETDDEISEIDYQYECKSLQRIYYQSTSEADCIDKMTKWLKDQIEK